MKKQRIKPSTDAYYTFLKLHFAEMEALGFSGFDAWVADYESEDWN